MRPIMTNIDAAPERILHLVSCNCKANVSATVSVNGVAFLAPACAATVLDTGVATALPLNLITLMMMTMMMMEAKKRKIVRIVKLK